jgi:hypothetical protein
LYPNPQNALANLLQSLESQKLEEHLSFFKQLLYEFDPPSERKFVFILPALESRLYHFITSGKSRGPCHLYVVQALSCTSALLTTLKDQQRIDAAFYAEAIGLRSEIQKIIEQLE